MSSFSIENLGYFFADALKEVVLTTSGFSFDILPPENDVAFDEMTGIMSLNGNGSGMVFVSAKEHAIRVLCSFMTGVQRDEVTKDDICDTLCELVNMTAGNAKLRFHDTQYMFSLSPPFVISGENVSMITKKGVHTISRILSDGELSLKLKVVFY